MYILISKVNDGRIWLFTKRFGLIKLTPLSKSDYVINNQSFGNGLFNIDDHRIDHPIITNNKPMPDCPSLPS